jgi:DNA modification methylase
MNIEKIDIRKLKSAEYNPRKDLKKNNKEYKDILNSIKEFGYIQPLIVNKDYTIIGGHQRLKVLKDLKYNEIDCIVIDVDKKKEKALNVALNKISGEWDFEKLTKLLQEIKIENNDDFTLTGFNDNELEKMMNDFQKENINENSDKYDDNFDVNKAKEEIVEPMTKTGNIYQLGSHLLLCGDSFNEKDREKIIGNKNIDMIFTDPPYDMGLGAKGCFDKSTKNLRKRLSKLIHFDVKLLEFLPGINTKTYYIFTSKDGIRDYLDIFKDYKFNILFWGKTNAIPMSSNGFIPDLEYLLCFTCKNKIWNNSLKPSSVYKKYYITSIQEAKKKDGDLHPTMKPLELIADKIRISSNTEGYVLDLFGGSGSTLIAAEQVKRKCLMIELDPTYCDVIIKRYINLKGSSDDVFLLKNNKNIPLNNI